MTPLPSQKELLQRYAYDPFTGLLYHRQRVSNSIKEDTAITNRDVSGYVRTKISGTAYKVHRIIWKMVFNEEPQIIDHINRNKADNRIINLRIVSLRENTWNKSVFDKQLVGSCRRKVKDGYVYDVYYRYNRKRHFIGTFANRIDAHNKYMEVHKTPCKDMLFS